MTAPHNAYVLTASRWYTFPTSTLLIGCDAPSLLNHMLREILSNLISAVKRWRVRLLGDRCTEELSGLNGCSLSRSLFLLLCLSLSFFSRGASNVNQMNDRFSPLSSSQHPLHGNQYFNMSNWIFVPHCMSDGGSDVYGCVCVTSFKRVYFTQYHLFSLPFT